MLELFLIAQLSNCHMVTESGQVVDLGSLCNNHPTAPAQVQPRTAPPSQSNTNNRKTTSNDVGERFQAAWNEIQKRRTQGDVTLSEVSSILRSISYISGQLVASEGTVQRWRWQGSQTVKIEIDFQEDRMMGGEFYR